MFEPEGAAKYKKVNSNIKRSMKKAKENWIGEQFSEVEENLKKNNSSCQGYDVGSCDRVQGQLLSSYRVKCAD